MGQGSCSRHVTSSALFPLKTSLHAQNTLRVPVSFAAKENTSLASIESACSILSDNARGSSATLTQELEENKDKYDLCLLWDLLAGKIRAPASWPILYRPPPSPPKKTCSLGMLLYLID
ncbi:hypothetical protein AVEN_214532-1 [Araneus ventricosus]|uniref:Uncharacterized protein n=1 Tax=Araneus ventricosus TaxID=182803 RepID=A0A4Y2GH00_ARAVE|nr:hypothetical protein AVEN_214532-1 [Araneus ventricosus]